MVDFRKEQILSVRRKKKRMRKIVLSALVVFFCSLIGFNLYINESFGITYYTVCSEKIGSDIRAVLLADLHCKEYGHKNEKLVEAIAEQKPDMILIAGDMVNYDNRDISVAVELCRDLVEIAPVYYCYGNHEAVLMHGLPESERLAVDEYIRQTGTTFFYNNFITATVNGNTIEIGGFQGTSHGEGFEEWIKNPLEEFEASDHFKLLISHFPGLYYEGIKADVNADLAVAAHYHGGLIRLPIFGGLYHPDDGFFPRYSGGEYRLEHATLIVSRGLGDHEWIPRINNQPELVVIDITGKEGMQE